MKFHTCRKYKTATVAYSLLGLWSMLIFLTIPFARAIQTYVGLHLGRAAFGHLVLAAIAVATVVTVFSLVKKGGGDLPIGNLAWIGLVSGIYAFSTIRLWKSPEEAIHFLEYGLLSYLAYSALAYHVKDRTIFFSVSLIVLFVGTADEIIQWLVPGRYWDVRDLGFNFLGGLLLQVAIWKGFRPESTAGPVSIRSIRILSANAAACVLLLGLCASNTPYRISWYTEKVPFLSYLRTQPAMMRDYGFKHRDSAIGVFYSRFTKAGLRKQDRLKAGRYSHILNAAFRLDYAQFLWTYNPSTDPFLYEMRIHLFRRDRHRAPVHRIRSRGPAVKKDATIAFKENLILETYYGKTLSRSRYRWSSAERRFIESHADTDKNYQSPVSSDLFTLFSERHLWAFILGLVYVLFALSLKDTTARRG